MPQKIKVGDVVANRGELKKGYIKGVELANSVSIDLPLLVINGAKDGPTLLLTSTEHGTEIQGIEVILRVMREEIDPQELRGAIIGIPVMNPTAFFAARYRSWIDHLDVGNVRADNPNGSAMEMLAYNIWTEAVSKADIWVNMHCNTRRDSLLYCAINTSDPRNMEQNIKLADAYGYTTIYSDKPIPEDATPTYRNLSAKKGIPYVLVEYIEGRWISEPSTSTGIRGTLNVMKTFNMIDGDPEPQTEEFPLVSGVNKGIGLIRPKRGGLIRLLKNPGEFIKKDETFAEIYNLHGDIIEEVKMTVNGYIWSYPCGDFDDTSGLLQTVNAGCGFAFAFIHEKDQR
jgi:hypothetical protein